MHSDDWKSVLMVALITFLIVIALGYGYIWSAGL